MSARPARALLAVIVALLILPLGGCAGNDWLDGGWFDDTPDLERTWRGAVVALPVAANGETELRRNDEAAIARDLARLDPAARWPVIVFLHGCTGIGNYPFLLSLAELGYVVVAPDSMARRFRPLQCDPRTETGGFNLYVYEFRLAEVALAVQELKRQKWVDPANLYLVGVSEGGVAAALYRGDEFRARVIAQWTCQGAPHVRGIAAPPESAILAVVSSDDPWYDRQRGDCGSYMGARPGSQSLVVQNSRNHDVLIEPAVQRRVVEFLESQRRAVVRY
ncbi:dienelactone hydrolase family protein [Oceanibacterium hippocampi]|uniref:Dienelactone hydrolase domain-containing protein n=1 Tax=Oceanibacterium hippocampi TaxID=745714 RepID=A0A1Y5S906_9PROT|nr:dienelactone hydrolase family protein [Oceanibacterium hippocampi]SLN34107.1 hypothetical protein OCH7691_01329 [Oceanibacterium hippocampi]